MKKPYLPIGIFCLLNLFARVNAQSLEDKFLNCNLASKVYQAYEKGNFDFIKDRCLKNKNNPFFHPACQLLPFLADKITPKELIEAFPENKNNYDLFLDGPWGCFTTSKELSLRIARINPIKYYDELLKLMAGHNRYAIKKVLNSVPWMDGVIAEDLLGEKLPSFILNHPDIVLKNWDLFKYRVARVDSDVYTEKVYLDLARVKKVVQNANGDNMSKTELLKYLDKELDEHKNYK